MTTPYRTQAQADPARPMTAEEATLAWLDSRMDEIERMADRIDDEAFKLRTLVQELRQATRRALEK